MLDIHLEIDRPAGQAIGIKEQLAMALEHIGDVRVVSVTETHPEQLRIGENNGKISNCKNIHDGNNGSFGG